MAIHNTIQSYCRDVSRGIPPLPDRIPPSLKSELETLCKVGQTFCTRGEQRLAIAGGIADDDVDSGEEDVSKEF